MTKKSYGKIESKANTLITNTDKTENKSLTNNSNEIVINNYKLQAKQFALSLIEKSLQSTYLNKNEKDHLILEISNALCIESQTSNKEKSSVSTSNNTTTNSLITSTTTTKKNNRCSLNDDHNEVCEVCEVGGDLLCCDTCTLVFHLKCFRPKLSNIPKGKWSCSFCILDGLAEGDSYAAKRAVRCMNRLNNGLDSDNEDNALDDYHLFGYNRINNNNTNSNNGGGEISIIKKGQKYILRESDNKKLEELGRFGTLEEALGSYKEHTLAIITSTVVNNDNNVQVDDNNTTNTDSKDNNDLQQQQVTVLKEESEVEALWCVHCLDDKQVILCAFCGCKRCFGKFDSHLLILCDYCERETHTYCLQPVALYEVPLEDPWYCITCKEEGIPSDYNQNNNIEGDEEGVLISGDITTTGGDGIEYHSQTYINNNNIDQDDDECSSSNNSSQDLDSTEKNRNSTKSNNYSGLQNKKGLKSNPTGGTLSQSTAGVAATVSQQQQQQRGRGRPRGSNKQHKVLSIDDLPAVVIHIAANTNTSLNNITSTTTTNHRITSKYNLNNIKSSMIIDKNHTTSNINSHICYPSTELFNPNPPPPLPSHLLYPLEDNRHTINTSIVNPIGYKSKHRDSILQRHGPVGLISSLKTISKINDRPWNAMELDMLLQFRLYGPMEDLEVACNTLKKQKELLLQKIFNIDPSFDPEIEFTSSNVILSTATTNITNIVDPTTSTNTIDNKNTTAITTTLKKTIDNTIVDESTVGVTLAVSSSNTIIDINDNYTNNSSSNDISIKPLKRSYNKMNKQLTDTTTTVCLSSVKIKKLSTEDILYDNSPSSSDHNNNTDQNLETTIATTTNNINVTIESNSSPITAEVVILTSSD